MGMIRIELPPTLNGSSEQQLGQIKNYLFRVAQVLNASLNHLSAENFSGNTAASLSAGGVSAETKREIQDQYTSLKNLIQKTADEVTSAMESMKLQFDGLYVAKSEFGEFQQATSQTIEANAEAIQQNFTYYTELRDTTVTETEFQTYKTALEAYIRSGLLDDSGQTPVYGVEIGELGENPIKVRITSEKISFYHYSNEVAYISNSSLYITTARITKALTLGNWQIDANTPVYGGLSFKWVKTSGVLINGEFTPGKTAQMSTSVILSLGQVYSVSISGGSVSYTGTLTCRQDEVYIVLGDSLLEAMEGTGTYGFCIYFTGSGVGLAASTTGIVYTVNLSSV